MSTNPAAPGPKTSRRVEPRTLRGFLDHLPQQALHRLRVIERLCPLAERFGFVPLDTPILEHLDVLLGTGGEETNKELFRLETPEEEAVGMRFDLTVPFARLLAQHPDQLKTPFRRYAFGPVFRADKPGPGRYRQFTQFDFDAAGSNDVAVDAEICALLGEAMRTFGVTRYRLEINNRKVVDALLADCGIADTATQKHVLRVIDKLDKVGFEEVRKELGPGRVDASGDKISGVGLGSAVIDRILPFVAITGNTRGEVIGALEHALQPSPRRDEALTELRDLAGALSALGVSEEHAVFLPSLARGLDYYTGPVFEMKLVDAPQFGTVMAGGRYDGLVERFSPNQTAATGASIGLDRLLAALEHLRTTELPRTSTEVLIVTFRGVAKAQYLAMAAELRNAGLNTEIFFGKKKAGVTDQLSHANLYGVPVAVIAGEDELARGEISVKDLREGAAAREGIEDRDAYREAGKAGQQTITRTDLVPAIKRILGRE